MVSTASLRPPALPTRSRTTDEIPRSTAARPHVAPAARILGRADPHLDGVLLAPLRRGGDRLTGRRVRVGHGAVASTLACLPVINRCLGTLSFGGLGRFSRGFSQPLP